MNFSDIFKKSFLEQINASDISTAKIVVVLSVTTLLAAYVFFVYRLLCNKAFYSQNFGISLIAVAIITSMIIVAVQSNVVISLGMVGALSIVRFRTAIKDPLDLAFLFWSISIGIICGASLYEVAVIGSLLLTVVLLVLQLVPVVKATQLLLIKADNANVESALIPVIEKYAGNVIIKSRNIVQNSREELLVELRTKQESELLTSVAAVEGVYSVSLIGHDGEALY